MNIIHKADGGIEWEVAGNIYTVELDAYKADKKIGAKNEARRQILAIVPDWKQSNLNARATELVEKKVDATITGDELAELAAIRGLWTGIVVPIRAASDAIEAEIDALTTVGEVKIFAVEDSPLWP